MKILHISESFEGGVASAVAKYADLTSEHEHFLLCSKRSGKLSGGILGRFSTVYDLTNGHFSAIKTVRHIVDKVQPDVIHCHSSFGGGYARLAYFMRKCPALMVYSPHCYAFERLDLSWLSRRLFYIMEQILSKKTDVVVACSKRELKLAKKLSKKPSVFFVPNLPSIKKTDKDVYSHRRNTVVMMGRLSPQKDPEWFAEIAKTSTASESDLEFIWLGDGDTVYKNGLENAGVRLTGWKNPKDVAKILQEAKVYVHTGRWEGFPIAILDALECGTPIIAREATYLEDIGGVAIARDTQNAWDKINGIAGSKTQWDNNREQWEKALWENTPAIAKERLEKAYVIDKKRKV